MVDIIRYLPAALGALLAVMSVIAFAVFGADKRRSKRKGARRVPERTLFALALLGGGCGAFAGMHVFHHKTKHWYFRLLLPLIALAQLAALAYLAYAAGGIHISA